MLFCAIMGHQEATDQEGSEAQVAIPLLEASEVKDTQNCILPLWQLLESFFQYQDTEALAVIQRVLTYNRFGQVPESTAASDEHAVCLACKVLCS